MSQLVDMNEFLQQLRSDISDIQGIYDSAKVDRRIVSIGKLKIKSMLEHSRSFLDYSAGAVSQLSAVGKNQKIYFPYGKTKEVFEANVLRIFPNLRTDSIQSYHLFESLQPYVQLDPWLSALCDLTNEYKHSRLVGQQRENSDQVVTNIGNMFVYDETSSILIDDPRDSSKALNLSSELSIDEIDSIFEGVLVTTEYGYVRFQFDSYNYDLLDFFQKIEAEFSIYLNEMRKISPQ